MRKHIVIPVTEFSRVMIVRHIKTATILFSILIALSATALLPVLILKLFGIEGPILDVLLIIAAFGVLRSEWHAYTLSVAHLTEIVIVPVISTDHTHLRCIKGLGQISGSHLCRTKHNTTIRHHRIRKGITNSANTTTGVNNS